MSISVYQQRANQFRQKALKIKQQLGWLSFIRLLSFAGFVFFLYRFTQDSNLLTIVFSIFLFISFFILLKWYDKLQRRRLFFSEMAKFNESEALFTKTNKSTFHSGSENADSNHPYSHDLDLFGEESIYQYLNRCSTLAGRDLLAKDLLKPDVFAIIEKQGAVKCLRDKIDFRQQLYAYGNLHQTKKKELNKLMHWVEEDGKLINNKLFYGLMIFPILTIASLLYYLSSQNETAFLVFTNLFVANLIIAAFFTRKIMSQLAVSSSITKILQNYSSQLQLIEAEKFSSSILLHHQEKLKAGLQSASQSIGQLASLFNYLESVVNLVVSLFLNGLFLFHIFILYRLSNWRKQYVSKIKDWLNVIGDIEVLSSYANLSYNNPNFCFPEMKQQPTFDAVSMGHILVGETLRVCNDVTFNPQKFVILTGSNMSGKSTFLRTLGTNLILAKAGCVACAATFQFFPFDIFVSMRITDSLQDSESLFYAELKRLQSIIINLEKNNTTFVILDEILRGTNSNDKRNGTIGLIKKMAVFDTFGIIATHDVVVTELKNEYTGFIGNKSFESEIINDELIFDYKLKDGVSNSLSASYLMEKMGII